MFPRASLFLLAGLCLEALRVPAARSITEPSITGTVGIGVADGSVVGSLVNSPSTTLSRISNGACNRFVTIAARWSLSPNLISATLTVSFSLITGTQPHSKSVTMVLRMFK